MVSLSHLYSDRITLVKANGSVSRDNIPAVVSRGSIQIADATLPIEVGDHLLRKLPNGMVEDYIVDDPVLNAGLRGTIQPFYTAHVRRSGAPSQQPEAALQHITNVFNGANARVNMNSTDNSINVASSLNLETLRDFLAQVKPAIGALPDEQRAAIVVPLSLLEEELNSETPAPSKIALALQSIKSIAEGAAGNLVASGIGAMVGPILASIL